MQNLLRHFLIYKITSFEYQEVKRILKIDKDFLEKSINFSWSFLDGKENTINRYEFMFDHLIFFKEVILKIVTNLKNKNNKIILLLKKRNKFGIKERNKYILKSGEELILKFSLNDILILPEENEKNEGNISIKIIQ